MDEALDAIEREMTRLRSEIRSAAEASDGERVTELRIQLRAAQDGWDALLPGASAPASRLAPGLPRSMRSVREQVLETLNLIGAPAGQKTIRSVRGAFFGTVLAASRLASLRRDEERSFRSRSSPRTHVCPALVADTFRPVRSTLASSEWPLPQRLLASGSERVNYLTMAVNLAETAERAGRETSGDAEAIKQLLQDIARNIPGLNSGRPVSAARIRDAAQRELDRLLPADQDARNKAADRAAQLDGTQRLFGTAEPQNT
ncbi:hypothetical protein [Streptomyces sp. WM6378]|uniref:hypothetical protein n=1 Tax=Streptomyces sp. WM6378 TaxID=1415557 RepID=UPI0006AE6EC1|nr:hypothetical protein [Streptomyces sp. WM6378]KOU43240.1 hypothetical protein ADK54_18210 [Streptomyces sp. WM6378]